MILRFSRAAGKAGTHLGRNQKTKHMIRTWVTPIRKARWPRERVPAAIDRRHSTRGRAASLPWLRGRHRAAACAGGPVPNDLVTIMGQLIRGSARSLFARLRTNLGRILARGSGRGPRVRCPTREDDASHRHRELRECIGSVPPYAGKQHRTARRGHL